MISKRVFAIMQRTVISISDQDNKWLDQQAKLRKISKTELVRQAIKSYKLSQGVDQTLSFAALLEKTSGILKVKDGVEYQQTLRDEWDR